MAEILGFLAIGLLAGIFGGLIGIGGGIIMIPAMVLLFKMSQHMAQGTSLAVMLPPVGLLGVLVYYSQGNVNLKAAAFICIGMFLGMAGGARLAHLIPKDIMQRVFAFALLLISLRMLLKR